jgi:hypothetical protein
MNAAPVEPPPVPPEAPRVVAGAVQPFFVWQLTKALGLRQRYKYVQPRILREGGGWKIVSPNCSRNIDREGGEIDIALLLPVVPEAAVSAPVNGTESTGADVPRWQLHFRDHARQAWVLCLEGTQQAVLDRLVEDEHREFWQ